MAEELTQEQRSEQLVSFYLDHAKKNGIKLNPDKRIVDNIVKGIIRNEKKWGKPYCPCRMVAGNDDEDKGKACPCIWHMDEIKVMGHWHCMLFVKE